MNSEWRVINFLAVDRKSMYFVTGLIFCVFPCIYLAIGEQLSSIQVFLNISFFPMGLMILANLKLRFFSFDLLIRIITMLFALVMVSFVCLAGTFYQSGVSWFHILTAFTVLFVGIKWGAVVLIIFIASILYNHNAFDASFVVIPNGHSIETWPKDVFADNFLSIFVNLFVITVFFKALESTDKKLFEANVTLGHQREDIFRKNRLAALGAIADGVTHEVNNPLMVISGHTQKLEKEILLDESFDMSKAKYRIKKIRKSSDRLTELTKVLKALSKDDRQVKPEPVVVEELFKKLDGLFYHKFKSAGVDLNFRQIGSMKDRFWCYENKLLQLLVNVISHSYERMVKENISEKKIEVILANEDKFIDIYIIDSCPSLPDGYEFEVFRPLFSNSDDVSVSNASLFYASFLSREMNGKLFIDRRYKDSRITLKLPKQIS